MNVIQAYLEEVPYSRPEGEPDCVIDTEGNFESLTPCSLLCKYARPSHDPEGPDAFVRGKRAMIWRMAHEVADLTTEDRILQCNSPVDFEMDSGMEEWNGWPLNTKRTVNKFNQCLFCGHKRANDPATQKACNAAERLTATD